MAEETEKYQEISRGHVLFQARLLAWRFSTAKGAEEWGD